MAGRLAALASLLLAAFAVFFLTVRTPAPIAAASPSASFCEPCALRLVEALGASPHPVGSPEHDRARDLVVAQMQALGLAPHVQTAVARRLWAFGPSRRLLIARIQNVVGRLPGRDPGLPALLLMAHYDSVPGSPGAADDAAGVAAALDAVRAIRMRGPPQRDIVVAITDGEELGLLGARAFFDEEPQARRVGFVINADVRGGGGRALMFETGDGDAGAVELLRRSERSFNGTSLLPFAYRFLPNDTDFTIARTAGLQGLNFAFIGRQFDYHAPTSTPANLDLGALQDIGEAVAGPALALAQARELPRAGPDLVFFDVLGLRLIAYPATWGWAPLALAALLILGGALRAAAHEPQSFAGVARGALAGVAALVAPALALWAMQAVAGGADEGLRPILARFPLFEGAALAAGLAGLMAAAAAPSRRDRIAESWLGVLLCGLVVAAAAQALAPLAAFVLVWPLAAGALAFLLIGGAGWSARWSWTVYALIAAVTLGWLGVLLHEALQGLDLALAATPAIWLGALVIWPLARAPGSPRWAPLLPATAFLALALGIGAWLRLEPPWSARYPRSVEPLLLTAADGRSWRATPEPVDAWGAAFLGQGRRTIFPTIPGTRGPLQATDAPRRAGATPVQVERQGDGFEIHAQPAPAGRTLDVELAATGRIAETQVQGAPLDWRGGDGRRLHVTLIDPQQRLDIRLRPLGRGELAVRWALWRPGWPQDLPPPPTSPRTMAWGRSPAMADIGERTTSW